MITTTHNEATVQDQPSPRRASGAEKALNFAALGCLVLGAFGIMRAVEMEHFADGLLCLFASIGSSALVCYLYFSQD
jgi:hypothetical protein